MTQPATTTSQDAARILLGAMLAFAGTSHLTFAREAFKAQVPPSLPLDADTIVVQSGIVEIALGSALMLLPKQRKALGWTAAAFFVAIFPGNIVQYVRRRDGFGLDTDAKRLARLFVQPALVAWALWATGACHADQPRR